MDPDAVRSPSVSSRRLTSHSVLDCFISIPLASSWPCILLLLHASVPSIQPEGPFASLSAMSLGVLPVFATCWLCSLIPSVTPATGHCCVFPCYCPHLPVNAVLLFNPLLHPRKLKYRHGVHPHTPRMTSKIKEKGEFKN